MDGRLWRGEIFAHTALTGNNALLSTNIRLSFHQCPFFSPPMINSQAVLITITVLCIETLFFIGNGGLHLEPLNPLYAFSASLGRRV
jgi:hypothetical protein